MVAAPTGDLYAHFPRAPVTEEGFQSSEEGSDLHSPIFEVPYPHEGASALSLVPVTTRTKHSHGF